MNFEVSWASRAFDQMGHILRNNPHRRAEFARALRGIADTLQDDPFLAGESRTPPDQLWVVGDLVIAFSVDRASRTVEIASIRLMPTRSP